MKPKTWVISCGSCGKWFPKIWGWFRGFSGFQFGDFLGSKCAFFPGLPETFRVSRSLQPVTHYHNPASNDILPRAVVVIIFRVVKLVPSRSLTFSPLKNDGTGRRSGFLLGETVTFQGLFLLNFSLQKIQVLQPQKINMLNPKITKLKSGKSWTTNLHFFGFQPLPSLKLTVRPWK